MDANLRARVRDGDPGAFSQLFDEHARAVYNQGFRMTGSWSAAEEAVSLTFLEAWRRRASVDPEGASLRPWLLGICVNVMRNASRAERRHKAALERLPPPPGLPDFSDDVAGRLDDAASIAALRVALGKLRRGEREVLMLCVWSGLGYADAAEALGIPVGTVRSRLARARQKLRGMAGDPAPPAVPRSPAPAAGAGEPGAAGGQLNGSRATAARPAEGRTR